MKKIFLTLFFTAIVYSGVRDFGIKIGVYPPGKFNAITDVSGVLVGQRTIVEGRDIRTGVTVILPHPGNIYQEKVPAAIYIANGYGKLTGISQVKELGEIETPIVLTNTLSVWDAARALVVYTMGLNPSARSINPVVGETNDGFLNNIRALRVREEDVLEAIKKAHSGRVKQGAVGAGTGTIALGYKGGIGTSSRVLPKDQGGYTVGVLVQTNFGGLLTIAGFPVWKYLGRSPLASRKGSCMMVVATDAPLSPRNLYRLAKRAVFGMARAGGYSSNGSGDYVIAFSTAYRIVKGRKVGNTLEAPNHGMTPLFQAVAEATEEAILNSLFEAKTVQGYLGTVKALPVEKVIEIMRENDPAAFVGPEGKRRKKYHANS